MLLHDRPYSGSISDAVFRVVDNSDTTKKLAFECSSITTATTRTLTVPDANTTIAGLSVAQTFSAAQTFSGNITQTGSTTLSTGTGAVSLNGVVTCASTITATTATLSTSLILSASNGDILSNTSAASDTKRVRFSGGGAASVTRGALINLYGANYAGTPSLLQLYSGTGGPVDILAPSGQLVQIGGGGTASVLTVSGTQAAIASTTDATSTTTGSLTTLGGVSWGVTKSAFGGGFFSTSPTIGVGYATGAGGAVTQITSRTTGVTLNKVCGQITLVSAAGSATYASFTVTNSAVATTDVIKVCQDSGTDKYQIHVTAVGAGSFEITFATTGGTTSEQPVFNFSVIKAVAA